MDDPDELRFDAPAEPDLPGMSPSLAPARIREALYDLVDERNRYRRALVAIYRYRRESTYQPAHVAWHIITVDIPEICREALEG